ncbi:hypothetical protein HPB50_002748 [Hyalomma asiaticum]|uniref:Uncharacterized protein n=1 Tax=Hyalomma asiaticum TaxID=266040 RepID=A0ACB7SJU6_HYAAI|nr:hypothetical protein HPB50_002748 [Hyalomma asiaticum]
MLYVQHVHLSTECDTMHLLVSPRAVAFVIYPLYTDTRAGVIRKGHSLHRHTVPEPSQFAGHMSLDDWRFRGYYARCEKARLNWTFRGWSKRTFVDHEADVFFDCIVSTTGVAGSRSEPSAESVGEASSEATMISRRKILSRSRDELNVDFTVEDEEDVWYQKEKLFKMTVLEAKQPLLEVGAYVELLYDDVEKDLKKQSKILLATNETSSKLTRTGI